MDGLIMTGQLLLALAILVGLHEFGHMITAKWFGMRVEKFSIGFPPKVFSKKFGDTEYMLGSIPLGGFVKISGMIDESLDSKVLQTEPEPYEFRAKPAWQRLIVMLGGIIMNVITGIIVFVCLVYFLGDSFLPQRELKFGIQAHELAQEIGLKTGDKIIEINGAPYEAFGDLTSADVLLESQSTYTVQRGDSIFKLALPNNLVEKITLARKEGKGFISPIFEYEVNKALPNTSAEAIGLENGDRILQVDGQDTRFFHQLRAVLQENRNQQVPLRIQKSNGEVVEKTAQVSEAGTLGFDSRQLVEMERIDYSFGESVVKGTARAFSVVFVQIRAFGKIFRGEINPANSLSGPIGIAQQFGGDWNWLRFWGLTGLLSMVLAFMNLLPIPALDGGHVTFLLYEMISGRKPGERFLENAQKVGMAFLLLLMAFVIGKEAFEVVANLFQ